MGAFFMSVSARTAGFATYSLGTFSKSGLLVIIILMIIGASPGSTGGGIKTSTFFIKAYSLFLSNYLSILFETRISVPLIPGSRYRADGGRNPAGIRVFTKKLACFLLNLSVTFERNKGNGQIAVAAFL